ncbi:MAG: hypothetical protein ACK4S0_00090 [Sediminibacterium sp.]
MLCKNVCRFSEPPQSIVSSCRRKAEEPVPSIHPELQIKAIHFPGIPDENVSVDPIKWIINVKMPAGITPTNQSPTIELSKEAQLDHSSELTNLNRIYGWKYYNDEDLSVRISSKIDPGKKINYSLKLTPSAPLKITQSKPLADFVIGDSTFINVDVENPYGNVLPQLIVFKNRQTGKEHNAGSIIPSLNKFRIQASTGLFEVGEYDISFQMANGTALKVGPKIAILQGKSKLEMHPVASSLIGVIGKDLRVAGQNLFEANVAFRLHYPNGTTVPLKATYTLWGMDVKLALPSGITPGYYGIEILRDNRPLGISYRLSVVKSEEQMMITALNNLPNGSYPSDAPMVLPHNQRIPVNLKIKLGYGNEVYRVVDRFLVTYVDESKPTSGFSFPVIYSKDFPPHFTVPSNVPAGRYKVYVQEISPVTKKVIDESEPFERIIVLQ